MLSQDGLLLIAQAQKKYKHAFDRVRGASPGSFNGCWFVVHSKSMVLTGSSQDADMTLITLYQFQLMSTMCVCIFVMDWLIIKF